ncbi:MAG: DUF4838 domain-containing protein [Candidatus Brocadiia bacterium]
MKKLLMISAVLLSLLVVHAIHAEVPVAREGKANARIVHNGHEKEAKTLQKYLKKITGAELPLAATAEAAPEGLAAVELRVVDRLPGASDKRTAEHAYRLKSDENRLLITAQSELGLDYAVYGLLQDHLGVGFYSGTYEHIPEDPNLTIPALDTLAEPAFYHRNPMFFSWKSGESEKRFALRNRMFPVDGQPHNAGHTFRKYGIHKNCPLDEEFHKQLGEMFKKQFAKRDADGAPLPVGQMDGPYKLGCEGCDKCQNLIDEEGSYAAPMLIMLNAALDYASEEYPEHEVMTFAYWNTLPVPKTIRPHKNLWIQIVSSDASLNQGGDHLGEIAGNPANRLYEHAVREWPRAHPTGKVTTWHWATGGGEYEWPNLYDFIEDLRFFGEQGIVGAQTQGSSLHTGNWSELKYWVWEQIKWNPDQDEDALIDRFLREYYGEKAAPHLRDYLKTAERLQQESGYRAPGGLIRWSAWNVNQRRKFLHLETTEQLAALLQKAHEAAAQSDNPVYKKNLDDASARSLDPVIIDAVREAEGFARVNHPETGEPWYVPGGRADMPRRIQRSMPDDRRKEDWFKRRAGGRIYEVQVGDLRADVVPNYRGRIVSLVHEPTGKELLAGDGYSDMLGARNHIQRVQENDARHVRTDVLFGGGFYAWGRPDKMLRDITGEENGLTVSRRFTGKKTRANGQWEFRLPNPAAARVHVKGGGIDKSYEGSELLYRTKAIKHELKAAADEAGKNGMLTVTVDRGDGIVIELRTPAAGWKNVQFLPDLVSRSEQFDMSQHKMDPQITPEGEMQLSTAGRFDWRRRPNWPGDYDVWPRDPAAMVRVFLRYNGVMDKEEKTLPEQHLAVRTDGEKREVDTEEALAAAGGDEEPVGRAPKPLKIIGDGRAINPHDGAELVWVPAGTFTRGSDRYRDEQPVRQIELDGYWIYKNQVTVERYKKFLEATGRDARIKIPGFPYVIQPPVKENKGLYPALANWYDAAAYAAWAGGSLPTEAQWEKAARGTDARKYPWGGKWDVDKVARQPWEQYVLERGLAHVGSAPEGASPYGALDMAGNAWEWVADWYAPTRYENAAAKNPTGPDSGTFKILRGGNVLWDHRHATTTFRFPQPPWTTNWVQTGFRLVIDANANGKLR